MQQARELKTLGKYRLIASLGKGGMAKVYLASMAGPAGFNKLLVIKILREDLEEFLGASSDAVRMFWEEARLAARLSHPNIVQTHEVGEIGGRYFMAMEYLDGQPYSVVLSRRPGSIPRVEHLRIISDIARALHYSHTLKSYQGESIGVVHRDVSPHNIIVTYDGQAKLLDFGVATTEDPEHETRVGVIKGKLDYIAPEQLRGEPIDGRADVFALGAVLWEALTGHRFAGGRKVPDANKVQARLAGSERRVADIDPLLPQPLVRIVERATALDPAARFADAAAFADALDAFIAETGERPSPKSLSLALAQLFEAERAEMNATITEQLQALKDAQVTTIEIGEGTGSLPLIERPQRDDGSSMRLGDSRFEPSSAARSGFARPARPRPSALASQRPRIRSVVAALVVFGVMVVGAALALLRPTHERAPHAEALAASAPKPAAVVPIQRVEAPVSISPRPAAEAESVLLAIDVVPPTANLTIDGVDVEIPFSGQFRKDASLHRVEVAAEGYRPVRQFVELEHDRTLTIALERLPSSTRRGGAASAGVRRAENPAERREPAPASESTAAQVPAKPVPGADIEVISPAAIGADIYQANPYRNQ